MASFTYGAVGEGVELDGSEWFSFYGQDFNPNVPTFPTNWTTMTCSNETSSFDLLGFQPGNEVGCYVWTIETGNVEGRLYVESSLKRGGTTVWSYDRSYNTESNYNQYGGYMYFGVDYDEIWSSSNSYTIVTNREFRPDGGGTEGDNGINTNFIVTNLSIDSSLHPSGYLWVEGNYLCYTDAIHGSRGYKHKINYDSYSGGIGDPGYIRVPSGTSGYIYYTDAYGRVRRTHFADERYGGNRYGSPGYAYVSNGDMEDGYGYLCFVDGNGMLRRMGNGLP